MPGDRLGRIARRMARRVVAPEADFEAYLEWLRAGASGPMPEAHSGADVGMFLAWLRALEYVQPRVGGVR